MFKNLVVVGLALASLVGCKKELPACPDVWKQEVSGGKENPQILVLSMEETVESGQMGVFLLPEEGLVRAVLVVGPYGEIALRAKIAEEKAAIARESQCSYEGRPYTVIVIEQPAAQQ